MYENVRIEDNRFDDICGAGMVISSARGVSIRGNIFCHMMTAAPDDTGGRYGINEKALIWLDHCTQVQVEDNRVYEPGAYLKLLLGGPGLDPVMLKRAREGVSLRIDESCPAP